MRRSYLVALGVLLAAALWLASPHFLPSFDEPPEPAAGEPVPATAESEIAKTVQVRVRRSRAEPHVDKLVLAAQTEFSRMATLRTETSGRVVAIDIAAGSAVREGDVIALLAMDDREAQMQQARALVTQRRGEYEAASKLSAQGYQSENRRNEAKAGLDAALAALDRARLDVERTTLRAPFDGVLQKRVAEVGDYLGVGDPVALIVDLDPMKIVAQLSERELSRLRRDVEGEARMVTGETVTGRIGYVSTVGDVSTRTFRLELDVANPQNRLAAGLTAELRLPMETVMAHILSPAALTLDDQGRIGVKSVDDNNVVVFHPVRIVADGEQGVWVAGLPDELSIVTVGHDFVLPGQRVIAVPETQAATPAAGDAS